MKKIIFIFIVVLNYVPAYAQDHAGGGVSANPIGYNIAFAEAYDEKGKPLTEVNKQVAGSPVLNENWGTGRVKLANGFVLTNADLQFDLFSNQLHFKRNNIAYAFADALKEFSMEFKDSDQVRAVTFRSGYPAIKKKTESTFYQLIAGGDKVQLLNYVSKEIRENYTYMGPVRKEYQLNNAWYVYDIKTGTIQNINLSKTSLLKALPAFAEAIHLFADSKNYKLKSEKEVIELFAVLNL